MKYTFRPNLFQRHCRLQLTDDALQTLDANGDVTKVIDLRSVRSLQRVNCGVANTPDGGKENMEQCVVRCGGLRNLTIKSASYAGPNEWDSHGAKYELFLSNLMDTLVRVNPSVTVTLGSGVLVVVWRALQVFSVFLVLIGITAFINMLQAGAFDGQSALIGVTLILVGVRFFTLSGSFAASLRADTKTVDEARAM